MKAHLLRYAVGFALCFAALPQASAAEPMFTDMELFTSGHDNVNIHRLFHRGGASANVANTSRPNSTYASVKTHGWNS